jgi:hypothetical protein
MLGRPQEESILQKQRYLLTKAFLQIQRSWIINKLTLWNIKDKLQYFTKTLECIPQYTAIILAAEYIN